ncbi:heavy metal-associated isoprenylated plant protein 26-like [Gossypium australe]|uniref:Heavy metal-associated isoprenylated plant protein 26-like n=1 Tax=Gossypium australe TaxID=47621 RepID=A0A5B6URR4_9ROSI|nr:heavy metal-associated isoprenylated plant protein 26-like [Gossypium australe]
MDLRLVPHEKDPFLISLFNSLRCSFFILKKWACYLSSSVATGGSWCSDLNSRLTPGTSSLCMKSFNR